MDQGGAGLKRYQDWRSSHSTTDPLRAVDPSAVTLQLYTSGTTGLPKGVMLSHRNILAGRREAVREQMEWNEWQEDDVNLVALPVGHIGGVGWAIVGFLNGAHTIVQREFVPAQVLEAIERQQVSKMFLVPTALHMLLLQPRVREIDYSPHATHLVWRFADCSRLVARSDRSVRLWFLSAVRHDGDVRHDRVLAT